MILDNISNPKWNIYYLGSLVLEELNRDPNHSKLVYELFEKVKQIEDISMNLFVYSIDWLYIVGAINLKDGRIEKCF